MAPLLIGILAACGDPLPTASPSENLPARSPAATTNQGEGAVWFELAQGPDAGGYQHGALTFIEVTGLRPAEEVRHGASVALLPGTHELRSYARPCSNGCGQLSAPADECMSAVVVEPRSEMTVTIIASPGSPCRLGLREGKPADFVGILHLSRYDGAHMPYPVDGRCVLIAQSIVPVLPDGWIFESEGAVPVALLDPDGRVVATEGEMVWFVGDETDEAKPFGCDLGVRFDVADVLEVDPFGSTR